MSSHKRSASPTWLQIVGLGVDAYLKMLLIDNFVHTDLHPGNIFVRARAEPQVRLYRVFLLAHAPALPLDALLVDECTLIRLR